MPSRRDLLKHIGGSLGALSLGWSPILAGDLGAEEPTAHPLAPKAPHFPAKAKQLVFIYLTGGFSHVESFDHKPRLTEMHNQPIPGKKNQYCKGSIIPFKPYGQNGTLVSDLFPHIGGQIDDICLIRSMNGLHNNHFQGTLAMHTGSVSVPMPSIGSWLSYGLGTLNANLPPYVVLAQHLPYAGSQVWDSSFLPAMHQGSRIVPGPEPIPDLARRSDHQGQDLELLTALDRLRAQEHGEDDQLRARMLSFKTARGMQKAGPRVFDLSQESKETRRLYGLQREDDSESFAWQCLIARRLLEAGVRVVELVHTGSNKNWDAHGNMESHKRLAKEIDQPIAGLLQDLKRTGLLDQTLVVFCTEFGRTPYVSKKNHKGREHYCHAFSSWIAGAGTAAGTVHGATDDFGLKVVDGKVGLHDFHATLLHLMGFDHERLTYRYAGRDFRLTDVHGHVVEELLG